MIPSATTNDRFYSEDRSDGDIMGLGTTYLGHTEMLIRQCLTVSQH
jgi:hypothetical protein